MSFDNSCCKAVLKAWANPNRCEPQLFLAALEQAANHWKALNLGSLNVQFQQDSPKDKKYSFLSFCLKT